MAGKSKDSSLLFSANISSPFDNISSTPILHPPISEKEKVEDEPSIGNNLTEPLLSLQPHLQSNLNSESSLETCPIRPSFENQRVNVQNASTLPPPIISTSVGSLLRRPTNKYVVPPEINATQMQPPISRFLPSQTFQLGTNAPFIPTPTNKSPDSVPYYNDLPSNYGSASSVTVTQSQNNALDISYESFLSLTPSTLIPTSFDQMASNPPVQAEMYHPVMHHWFYAEGQQALIWKPFSFTDSLNLEDGFREGKTENVATEGGRYDVNIIERKRIPIYWEADSQPVMRCSWFRRTYSGTCPVPFSEDAAEKLEAEYRDTVISSVWQRQVELSNNERVMINSPSSMLYYQIPELTDILTPASPPESNALLSVRRGTVDFVIKEGASDQVDHLLFLIHGIGSVCDLSFRSVEECVDDFRTMGEELLSSHFKEAIENGKVGRVEILPISWHKALHGDATGLDAKLKHITLRSIPKFREFTNDTLLDILFYTSPVYCQHIMDTVSSEMERLLALFSKRNPSFNGSVSVGGHSLGTVILFDLLMHQNPTLNEEPAVKSEECKLSSSIDSSENNELNSGENNSSLTSQIEFQIGVAGTGQPLIIYPQLSFKPKAFFLMGSPVGMFITVRGIDTLGPSFKLPTCDRVFNIFHPFDPVAYRIETLIDTSFEELRPVLVPHHKGRKRMHLELKDTIERVGSDIKNKIVDSIQSTWNRFYQLYTGNTAEATLEEVDQALEEHINRFQLESEVSPSSHANKRIGELNRGERIDYVLQEKPYESLTEYIFALQAHVSYWKSEDTLLLILKELYKLNNINSDKPSSTQQHTQSSPFGYSPSSNSSSSVPRQSGLEPISEVPFVNTNLPLAPVPLLSNNVITTTSPLLPQLGLPSQPGFSSQSALPSSQSAYVQSSKPRTLRGRPVFDPSAVVMNNVGMDPTVSPTGGAASLPPPPILPNVCFNNKKPGK